MIINKKIYPDAYRCGEKIMRYLALECHIPVLSVSGNYYYFANTEKLREALDKMPITLKALSLWQNR